MLHDGHVRAQRARAAALRLEGHATVASARTLRAHGEELVASERINIGAQLESGELVQRIKLVRQRAKARGERLTLASLVAAVLVDQAQRLGTGLGDVATVIHDQGMLQTGAAEEAERTVDLLEGLLARQTAQAEGNA